MGRYLSRHSLKLVVLSAICLCQPALADDTDQINSRVLMQSGTSWDGVAYKKYPDGAPEITVLKMSIPPHTTLSWHRHPMPNAAYVLSGSITVEKMNTDQSKVLTEGQVLPEMVGELHRGVTGEKGVQLIVFYAGTKDMPLSQKIAF